MGLAQQPQKFDARSSARETDRRRRLREFARYKYLGTQQVGSWRGRATEFARRKSRLGTRQSKRGVPEATTSRTTILLLAPSMSAEFAFRRAIENSTRTILQESSPPRDRTRNFGHSRSRILREGCRSLNLHVATRLGTRRAGSCKRIHLAPFPIRTRWSRLQLRPLLGQQELQSNA